MNLGELRAYARTRLDDMVEPYLWADQYLDQLINNALVEVALRSLKSAASTQSSVDIVALSGAVAKPMGLVRILSVKVNGLLSGISYSKVLPEASVSSLGRNNINWASHTAEVPSSYFQDLDMIGVYPRVTSDIQLSLEYITGMPTPLVLDTDVPGISSMYHHQLIFWVLYEALSILDADSNNEVKAKNSFDEFEKAFGLRASSSIIATMRQMSPNQTINKVRM